MIMNKKTSKPKIKAVIFDLGGVVMSGGYLPFIHHYCLECVTKEGKVQIKQLEHQVNLGKITEFQFYRAINKIFHVQVTPQKIHKLIIHKMRANKHLLKFLPKLKPARVVLFSNSIGNMAREVLKHRRVPTKRLFDKIFFSNKIHLAKPDKHAYKFIIKKLKIKPNQTLLVDDREDNILPAQNLGMHGIVFKNVRQFRSQLRKYELV